MESAQEAERLESKTDAAVTIEHLKRVGLMPGSRALDAGAGTGAVARVISKLVGPEGSVVAFDASQQRLRFGRERAASELEKLTFVAGDLYHLPFQTDSFDFVWCRFIFEYLEDPDEALRELTRVARRGGKVVVGDLDGNGVFHYPLPADLEVGLMALLKATRGRFDPYAGRKLYHRCVQGGLREIKTHVLPYHLFAGAAPKRDLDNWKLKLHNLRPLGEKALGGGDAYERLASAFMEFLRAPETLTYSVLFLVEGRKGV
jgi:SAM-dependent methyltransferase